MILSDLAKYSMTRSVARSLRLLSFLYKEGVVLCTAYLFFFNFCLYLSRCIRPSKIWSSFITTTLLRWRRVASVATSYLPAVRPSRNLRPYLDSVADRELTLVDLYIFHSASFLHPCDMKTNLNNIWQKCTWQNLQQNYVQQIWDLFVERRYFKFQN